MVKEIDESCIPTSCLRYTVRFRLLDSSLIEQPRKREDSTARPRMAWINRFMVGNGVGRGLLFGPYPRDNKCSAHVLALC